MYLRNWMILLTGCLLLWGVQPAFLAALPPGQTLTVTGYGDFSDINPGDGHCDTNATLAGDQCSLRAAIEELNAIGPGSAPHRIEFAIAVGAGPFTITPASPLPAITVPVVIDGTTQPGASCPTASAPANLMIVLDGSSTFGLSFGLSLDTGSDGSMIQGLAIGNFYFGISVESANNNLYCNHVGLGTDGVTATGNYLGLFIPGEGNNIGGLNSPDQRNVIAGNVDMGVLINSGDSNIIAGNFIGTTSGGTSALPNDIGVWVGGANNKIIQNLIGGNGDGVRIGGSGIIIQGNDIGVLTDGATPLPNTSNGIMIYTDATLVGGPAGAANRIAFNGGDGVRLEDRGNTIQNEIRRNFIYANGGLGIDLVGDGVDSNDPGDTDSGINEGQNYPVLASTPGSFVVEAELDGQPITTYSVDIYRSEDCDPSGHGEGEQYVDTMQVTTDGTGHVAFDIDLVGVASSEDNITATATDLAGNTSEFSNCVTVTTDSSFIVTVTGYGDFNDLTPGDGHCDTNASLAGDQCSLRAAIEELNTIDPGSGVHRIEFAIAVGAGPFTITPATPLPAITVPVTIDGETQPGAACPTANAPANLMIVLDGSNTGASANGLTLDPGSDGSILSGLAIGNFDGSGIHIESNQVEVRCSHLGLSPDGTTTMSNGLDGVRVNGSYNVIGGPNFPAGRNVISGNAGVGVYLSNDGNANEIIDNFIGTTSDGMSAAGNLTGGVYLAGVDSVITGADLAAGQNVISGNAGYGIRIDQGDESHIMNNYIGLARDGLTSLPNGGNGIEILGEAYDNEIGNPVFFTTGGGTLPLSNANRIAYNGGHGIVLKNAGWIDPNYNLLYQNAIYDNGGMGIDLGDDGVNANDPGDGDGGANSGQNYPLLSGTAGSTIVTVTLNSESDSDYEIDLFRSTACDPSGYGEGEEYLLTVGVTTDASGNASSTVDLVGLAFPGESITAISRGDFRVTSEFSNCVTLISMSNQHTTYLPLIRR